MKQEDWPEVVISLVVDHDCLGETILQLAGRTKGHTINWIEAEELWLASVHIAIDKRTSGEKSNFRWYYNIEANINSHLASKPKWAVPLCMNSFVSKSDSPPG